MDKLEARDNGSSQFIIVFEHFNKHSQKEAKSENRKVPGPTLSVYKAWMVSLD